MPKLPIIGPYQTDPAVRPRVCSQANLSSTSKCYAELILHDENGGEEFLCKQHASHRLSRNLGLLASAVIELSLAGR